jgi:hypothetical protein
MKILHLKLLLACTVLCCSASAQLKVQKITEPAGKVLEKALKQSLLIQPGAKPFHIKLSISPAKGDAAVYSATIEETWVSTSEWKRTLNANGFSQTIIANASGMHYVTTGDYLPNWLRGFVTALFTPVPNVDQWSKPGMMVEHIELPNGAHSNPCMHAEFKLGIPPVQQVNFSNVCFKDGLLDFVGGPNYGMEFHDYSSFGKLKVPRKLIEDPARGVNLVGAVVVLEEVTSPPDFAVPADASDKDPLMLVDVSTEQLHQLAGGTATPKWPTPIPGHGMFTVWVSVDHDGVVREAHPLNSDESGFAADMAATLVGQHWKGAVSHGGPVQIEGALVFSYPPEQSTKPGAP